MTQSYVIQHRRQILIGQQRNHHRRVSTNNVARIRSKNIEKRVRTNSRNIIGRNPSMVMPLLANQDLTPMLCDKRFFQKNTLQAEAWSEL